MTFAYWSMLIAALLPYVTIQMARGAHVSNHNPRAGYANGTPYQQRAYAAHLNGFEAFPFYAVAVIVATQAGAMPLYVNILAVLWVLARIVYIVTYLKDIDKARSAMFAVTALINILLFTTPLWPIR